VRHSGPVEGQLRVRLRRVRPLAGVADESIADVDQLLRLRLSERGTPTPAEEHREARDEQRVDDARGRPAALPAQTERDDLGGDVPSLLAEREGEHANRRVDA